MACWNAIGLGGDENAGKRLTVLRAIDKLDRLGAKACALARRRRKDESGDFTKGAGLRRTISYRLRSCDFTIGLDECRRFETTA